MANTIKKQNILGNILIMDSDKKTVQQVTESLGNAGYNVESIEQPSEMIEKIKQGQIDALILDVEALGIKGYELIPSIKKIDRFIPIIVTSIDDSIEVATKVREQGIFFYSIKPLNLEEIKLALRKVLNKKFIPGYNI